MPTRPFGVSRVIAALLVFVCLGCSESGTANPAAPSLSKPIEDRAAAADITSHDITLTQTPSPLGGPVIVAGNRGWTDTGVRINIGDEVRVAASGEVTVTTDGHIPPMPPGGFPPNCAAASAIYGRFLLPFPAPQLPCWSLLGRVGTGGIIFGVGTNTVLQAQTAGELYLGVNDNNLSDNSGSWTVTLSVTAQPVGGGGSPAGLTFAVVSGTGAADRFHAGTVVLRWTTSNATSCALTSAPSIVALTSAVPCNQSSFGLPLPINRSNSPQQYVISLSARGTSGATATASLSVFALPAVTFGRGGTPYTTLVNTATLVPKPAACQLPIPLCWFQFGLADKAAVSGTHFSLPAGAAKALGVAIAGVGGVNFALAADSDSLTAAYGPYPTLPPGYSQYLAVQTYQVTLVGLQACGALEGGAGTNFSVLIADQSNSYQSPLQTNTCAHLLSGPGGETYQGALAYAKFLVASGALTSDAAALLRGALTATQSDLSAISSKLENLLNDLGASPLAGGVSHPEVPVWYPAVTAGAAYHVSITPIAALASIGLGVGAAEAVISQTTTLISGVAVRK
jgi:hypothetical protein